MTKEVVFAQAREDRIYIEILEKENSKLIQAIDQEREEMRSVSMSGNLQQEEANRAFKFELLNQNAKLKEKVEELKQKVKTSTMIISDKDAKIAFLEKIIIEKEN